MKQEGYLDVIIATIEERADWWDERIRATNALELLRNQETILNTVARQAHLREDFDLIALFNTLAAGNVEPKPRDDL